MLLKIKNRELHNIRSYTFLCTWLNVHLVVICFKIISSDYLAMQDVS